MFAFARSGLEDDVEDLIIAANADPSVDGIMVYFPVFGGRQDTYSLTMLGLRGPRKADFVYVRTPTPGCSAPPRKCWTSCACRSTSSRRPW